MRIERERIKSFAAEFDPQPFHLDEAAARDTIFGGLAASGWHTAALTMRLLLESEFKPSGGIIGTGFDGRLSLLQYKGTDIARTPAALASIV